MAWKRAKSDQRPRRDQRRVFIRHPYEVALVEIEFESWLSSLQTRLCKGEYKPQPQIICDAPKSPISARPGGILALEDRVVFAAAVALCLPQLVKKLRPIEAVVDFSYQLAKPGTPEWLKNRFECWSSFRKACASALTPKITHVVVADIAGYYENIDIFTLLSDLRAIDAPGDAVEQLSKCLNRWARLNGRSIPQGHSPADILAKLYLSPVDSALRDLGHRHFRFVDDFRIFCRSLLEAKRALLDLTRLLRARGLVLNSSKSQILGNEQAQEVIDGRIPVIEGVRRSIVNKITEELGAAYVNRAEAESVLGKPIEEISVDLIEETFDAYFLESPQGFSPTLFHFLLNRLAAGKSQYAVNHCLSLLGSHPEETEAILDYIGAVTEFRDVESAIIRFLKSPEARLYSYQTYQIFEWLSDLETTPSNQLLAIVRKLAFDVASEPYVRSISMKLLGDFGTHTDLDRLENYYSNARNPFEQCDVICALRRMELVRRNSFLGRAQNDNDWTRRAAAYVRRQPAG